MKLNRLSLLGLGVLMAFTSCNNPYSGVSPELADLMKKAIESTAPERQTALTEVLAQTPKGNREGMAYLLAYMSKNDIDTMNLDLLKENVDYAYKAYNDFAWTKELPKEIFLNEVMPYAVYDEVRDSWRPMFYEMFSPLVQNSTDIFQAIDTVNKSIKDMVGVTYNTKRRKANQSPRESMEIHMASCTGLSILLVDALRAVGIPARLAGTPMWVSLEGNHNWVEVWADGKWYVTEYSPEKLDHAWFMPRAGKADKSKPIHWIYAVSYKPTGLPFPRGRRNNPDSMDVTSIDVTDRYIALYKGQQTEEGKGTPVVIKMFKNAADSTVSAARVASKITVFNLNADPVAEGKTAGPTQDMNDYLTLYVPVNGIFDIQYEAKDGVQTKRVNVEGPTSVILEYGE